MSNRINIEEILKKHLGNSVDALKISQKRDGKLGTDYIRLQEAIKEIVELTVDKCAEEGRVTEIYRNHNKPAFSGLDSIRIENPNDPDSDVYVDKESILQVKQMINYGTD